MKIIDLLDKKSILLNATANGKADVLEQAIALMAQKGNINHIQDYTKAVLQREEEGTTGVGDGIAIPHGRGESVDAPGLAAIVLPEGVEYDALDGEPVHLLFLIAAPNTKDNVHLDVLAKLSTLLMNDEFVANLKSAETPEQFLEIINQADQEEEKDSIVIEGKNFLAVTACPTGIAHTYMAAESLTKAANALNCSMKVETRGSGGAKNVLTEAEIEKADGIIIAADTQVPMERFDGKQLIECKVADGIHKATELVETLNKGEGNVYKSKHVVAKKKTAETNIGRMIYNQLMNGVSHMLPFVVGGGILIALAFLIDGFSVDLNSLPEDMRGNFGSITPIAAMFKEIGGLAFSFMLPVLAGFIAMAIGDRPALALGFVGGMFAASGNSGFLGALVAGFLAGYIILGLRKVCEKLPDALEKISPVLIYPVLGIFIIGIAMIFVVEPVMGTINLGLNNILQSMGDTSKVLLGVLLGGMMAIDMGGPFNKAAYVFGTASIASGNYDIMAAVMIGGMVPPCAIALSTLLSKKKYTKEERNAGPTNFIMGLAFITEGAIPYAAADPLRVLPACVIASGLAGGLSMLFHCTLMAPHGGIFVFPVVGNGLFYLIALVVSSIVGALLLGIFKKNIEE